MPIQANNCDPAHRLGAHSAHFRLFSGGALNGDFAFPLAGPKSIRRIVVITGVNDNVLNAGMTLAVTQSPGGDVIAAAKAGDLANNSLLTWEESELDPDYTSMGTALDGLSFDVSGSGAAYDFKIEVIYDSQLLAGLQVCKNQDVDGL